jgi:capsular exopolysaccharide synthesis family protein
MPDHSPPGVPQSASASALQVRNPNALSTYVLPPAIAGAGEEDDSIHLRDLWRVVVKRKWVVIAAFLIVVATVLVVTMMQTPIYRASITMKIERETPKVIDFKGAPTVPEESGDADFYRTQYELLKSRTLAERVVKDLGLRQQLAAPAPREKAAMPWWKAWLSQLRERVSQDDKAAGEEPAGPPPDPFASAVGAFQGSMTVDPIRNSRLVRVYFDSPDPRLAADALNALARNFIAVNLERRYDASSYAKTFLEEKLAQTKTKLEDSERALVDFQREQQIINVDEKQNVLAQTLASYNAAASKAGEERLRAEALYREFKENPQSSPQMLDNKSVAALREQRTKLSVEYQDGLRIYKPMFPKMQQIQASIDEIDKKIAEESQIVRRSIEGQYSIAVQQEAAVKAKLDAVKKDVLDLQGRSVRYGILKREVETNRSLYDGLLQRLKEVGVEAGVGTNNVTVVDSALAPGSPFKPNLTLNLQLAAVFGLLLGVGLAFFLDYLDDTMQHPEDMERIAHLPVLGVIPLVKPKRGNKPVAPAMLPHVDARSAFAEAYRSVRTALQFSTREGAPKQLVVTSTTAKEGKSTTALALAINFAQADQPTLLVDADLRNPALHELLGVDNSRGLSNYLASDLPALGVVRVTTIPNLYVIPAGPTPPNPVELLSGPKMLGLLADLDKRFTRIVLDSPPVLGLADALVLGNQVGAVMFVVAAGTTRKAHLRAALKRLRQASVAPIGAVMTKLDLHDGMYGYESAYYHYRSTGEAPKLT